MNQLLIKLSSVNVTLHQQCILKDVNLCLYDDQIVTIVGPNGAGKTTLLRVLLGLITPTNGSVWKIDNLSIGYMPQKLQINQSLPLTVARFLKLLPNVTTAHINQTMEAVGAPHVLNRSIHTLSGGELQRVLLARALLRKPKLLVLDEPAQGVDINGQIEFYRLINHICNQYHCGVIMVSHDLNLVMANTDQVICLNQHICCSGHPQQVSNNPAFLKLFGNQAVNLAIYQHHHDHKHSLQGDITASTHCHKDDCHHA